MVVCRLSSVVRVAGGGVAVVERGPLTRRVDPGRGPSPIEGLLLAVGFSGHGFKMAHAVGRLVAELLTEGTTTVSGVDPADCRYSRFAEGRPTTSPHPYVGAGEMR